MDKFQVRYTYEGQAELSAPFSRAFCELLMSRYTKCWKFTDVEIVEAQQPAPPDIADDRLDVQAGDGGDGYA